MTNEQAPCSGNSTTTLQLNEHIFDGDVPQGLVWDEPGERTNYGRSYMLVCAVMHMKE
jgi:hypothetical protein